MKIKPKFTLKNQEFHVSEYHAFIEQYYENKKI